MRIGVKIRFGIVLTLGMASTPALADTFQERLIAAASSQIGVTVNYDGSYRRLAFPGGDVPIVTGVCTDVVIRAYRGLGIDLQLLVHEDMKRAWSSYPRHWGLRRPDANIDHRRVPNLAAFFRRHNASIKPSASAADYRPGDLVTWNLPGNLPHIGIVSSRANGANPLIIHNIGRGTAEDDILFAYPITGHYRYVGTAPDSSGVQANR
jgi:uncharacterized protein YijF (DUF1287 family)